MEKQPESDRLDGWKDIAAYLKKDTRTVQRWEKEEALPIHRHDGPKPRVFAYRGELDAWWREHQTAEPARQSPALLAWLLIGVAVVLAVGVAVLWRRSHAQGAPPPLPDRIFARAEAERGSVRKVPVKGQPVILRMSPDARELYVIDNTGLPTLQVVDPDRLTVTRSIAVAGGPLSLAVDPAGRTIYVGTISGGLYIIDRRSRTSRVLREGIDSRVVDLLMTPDGRHLYITLELGGLKRLDLPEERLVSVWTDRCPAFMAMDPAGKLLFVSCGCGPGKSPVHDTIEVVDVATGSTVRVLKGPPMIAGPLYLFPRGEMVWAHGWDACVNPRYRNAAPDCPVFPGSIHNIFRISDGVLVRSIGVLHSERIGSPLLTADGARVITAGAPPRVLDTTLFRELERLEILEGDEFASPVVDLYRRRIYFAGVVSGAVYALDLPAANCNPPAFIRTHLWSFDGTLNDITGHKTLSSAGPARFFPGLVGRAVSVENTQLETEDPYTSLAVFTQPESGTIAGWIKVPAAGEGTIFALDRKRLASCRLVIAADSRLCLEQSGQPTARGTATLRLRDWHHIALVGRPDRLSVYVDASLYLEAVKSGGFSARAVAPSRLSFGPFPGLLDEAATYDRALSPEDLREIVASGHSCLTLSRGK